MKFENMYRYVLTFGRNIGNTARVSDEQLESFLRDTVGDVFDAFSVAHHTGYWDGTQEDSFVVTIVIDSEEDSVMMIKRIAQAYNRRFSQDCVMVTRESITVAFEGGR